MLIHFRLAAVICAASLFVLLTGPALAQDAPSHRQAPRSVWRRSETDVKTPHSTGRQCLDAHVVGPGADDDRARTGHVLQRPGPQEERAERHDAVLFLMGLMTVFGAVGLLAGASAARTRHRQRRLPVHEGRPGAVDVDGKAGHSACITAPTTFRWLTHMLFQGMFFIITPALICGAFAERMKFSTMVVFMILWGTLVYCPLSHWVWGGGILAYGSELAEAAFAGGALDFAGGTVVHISSGVSALICALVMGKRLGYGSEPMPPHNLTYTALGAALLWVGWFGFNAGSALAADGLAASAFCATHFAAAAGASRWAGMEWITRGKPSVLGAARAWWPAGLHHAGLRLRAADAGARDGRGRWHRLLLGLHDAEIDVRLRRFARRLRRPRRRRHAGRHADRRFRHRAGLRYGPGQRRQAGRPH